MIGGPLLIVYQIFFLFVLPLAAFMGLVLLQIYLSKRDSKWLGLIMPITTFTLSLLVLLAIMLFSISVNLYSTEYRLVSTVDIVEITGEPRAERPPPTTIAIPADGSADSRMVSYATHTGSAMMLVSIFYFLLLNIPTAVFLIIYAVCRGKRRQLQALGKMSAQDL